MKKYLYMFIGVFILINNASTTQGSEIQKFDKLSNQYNNCVKKFNEEEKKCPESGSMQCYDYLISLHHKTQDCYTKVAKNIFLEFYNQSKEDISQKIKEYIHFMHEHYLFIYADMNYCKQNNCGVSIYLYSEYATTQALSDYIFRALSAIKARQ